MRIEHGHFFIPPPDTQPEIISVMPKSCELAICDKTALENAVKNAYEEWLKNPPKELFKPTKKQVGYM